MVRLVIVVLYVPVLVYAFVARLISEVRSAFWFAWNEVRIEHSEMRRCWRSNRFNPEDWK
ncbi:hypothetical protein NKJ51_12570 [Mesorhizobium sp. M0134]|uniref:hypothetical protein n=1 Tax=Mesorhizobium sp. M0134 TaxID=2956889 RepID=UPI00333D3CA3